MPETDDRVRAEVAAQPAEATLAQVEGRWVLTMARALRHPPERLWPYLTDPRLLARWSPVVPDRAFSTIGPATSRETPEQDPVDAEVLVSEPPHELVHRWGGHLLRWTLAPTAAGSRLTLEHTFDRPSERGSYGAGWHLCLAVLALVVDGHDVERVVGERALDYGFAALNERYEASAVSSTSGGGASR